MELENTEVEISPVQQSCIKGLCILSDVGASHSIMSFKEGCGSRARVHQEWKYFCERYPIEKYPIVAAIDWIAPEIKQKWPPIH